MASKRIKNKIESIFRERGEPMTTRQIIQELVESMYKHVPSDHAVGQMMRDKRFSRVGEARPDDAGPIALWYLQEVSE